MNVLKFATTAFVLSTFLAGCGNTTTETQKDNAQTKEHEEHEQHDENEAISLNNGEKWLVNEEMKPFILEAETALNAHIESASSDYATLAAQLKEKNAALIKSCTMQGISHDELHKWLYPHIELIDALAKAENATDAGAIINQLKTSFNTYHNYFI